LPPKRLIVIQGGQLHVVIGSTYATFALLLLECLVHFRAHTHMYNVQEGTGIITDFLATPCTYSVSLEMGTGSPTTVWLSLRPRNKTECSPARHQESYPRSLLVDPIIATVTQVQVTQGHLRSNQVCCGGRKIFMYVTNTGPLVP
jgi:hypothetical protein